MNDRNQALARRLIRENLLSAEDVDRALLRLESGDHLDLGSLLVAEGVLDRGQLEALQGRRNDSNDPTQAFELVAEPGSPEDQATGDGGESEAPTQFARISPPSISGPDPLIGRVLGGVRLCEVIGQGGMGRVYRGHHERLDQSAVVKVLRSVPDHAQETEARFRREARACARLRHPNVIQVYDVDSTPDGVHFITMEYVEGETLQEHVVARGGSLPETEAVEIVIRIAEALGAAHEKGIVHRDVKPSNVLISNLGEIKVGDFGLALDLWTDEKISQTGQMMGTPDYMSPEQWEGQEIGPSSDLFSLGVLFYYLLSGRTPHAGASAPTVLRNLLSGSSVDLPSHRAGLSGDIVRIVHRLLELEPNDRYASVEALVRDLGQATIEETISLPRGRRPGRAIAIGVGVATVLLVGVAFWGLSSPSQENLERPEGPSSWEETRRWWSENPDRAQEYLRRLETLHGQLRAGGEADRVQEEVTRLEREIKGRAGIDVAERLEKEGRPLNALRTVIAAGRLITEPESGLRCERFRNRLEKDLKSGGVAWAEDADGSYSVSVLGPKEGVIDAAWSGEVLRPVLAGTDTAVGFGIPLERGGVYLAEPVRSRLDELEVDLLTRPRRLVGERDLTPFVVFLLVNDRVVRLEVHVNDLAAEVTRLRLAVDSFAASGDSMPWDALRKRARGEFFEEEADFERVRRFPLPRRFRINGRGGNLEVRIDVTPLGDRKIGDGGREGKVIEIDLSRIGLASHDEVRLGLVGTGLLDLLRFEVKGRFPSD